MLVIALALAIVAGYLRDGSLRNLAKLQLRAEPLVFGALLVQLTIPVVTPGLHLPVALALSLWLASFALLLIAVFLNREQPGLLIAGLGVASNMLVIALNAGMPVTRSALESIAPTPSTVGPHLFASDPLRHLASSTTRLPFLSDAIAITWPPQARAVVSVGDLLLVVGVFWLVQQHMVSRGKHRVGR
ncbi:MAG: hypothetical protein C4521_03135 [Actinobacteria bacterium]|nr:MAG: hypothetical protein C4521_03135 [Actinomycetota bacterium]